MSHKNYEDLIPTESIESMEDMNIEEVEETVQETIGVVTDCLKLNIRKEPSKDSEAVAIATCLDELMIDMTSSTDDWYAVCTAAGIEGFCMKKFVAVRQ